jgi:ABC-2 type transport system permease protein
MIFLLMTAMALGLTFVFGMSMSQYRPTVLIVDQDQSRYSGVLIDEIMKYDNFQNERSDYKNAVKSVESGDTLTALVIDKGFGQEIAGGKQTSLGIVKIKDQVEIITLQKLISSTVSRMMGSVRISAITADFIGSHTANINRGEIEKEAYDKVMESWSYKRPVEISKSTLDAGNGKGYDSMKHTTIGFSIFFSMYAMVFGIGTILNDKHYKTWQRMLVSPVSGASILGGSMIVAYLEGAVQFGVLIIAGKYLFGIDWGSSTAGILTVAAAFVFAVTCLGLMLSGLVKSFSQLSAVTPVVLTSTAMLGGCMWPLDIVNSKVILFMANFTPQKWAMQGMERIASYGQGFEAAVLPTIVLIGMGVVFFAAGVKLVSFE